MPLILGTNSIKDTGFDVANSLRLNSGDSAQMNKTLGTATDVDKYTLSMWVKRARLGHRQMMMRVINPSSTSTYAFLEFQSDDKLGTNDYDGSGSISKVTNRLFRDVSAWYHIVLALDSTQSSASDRSKLYINGVLETSFANDSGGSQNQNLMGNTSGKNIYIGGDGGQNARYCGLYMAEVCFIDGQQLAADQFGEFDSDTNIWKPIDVSGLTFGNNGFYLDFEDSSNLGNDANGGTDLTEVNIASTDQSTDTCINNFATLNPLDYWSGSTAATSSFLSEGNLDLDIGSSAKSLVRSTIGVTSGKWYWEVKVNTKGKGFFGFCNANALNGSASPHDSTDSRGIFYYDAVPDFRGNSGDGAITTGIASIANGDILNFALDMDNYAFYIGKAGTYMNSGNPTSGSNKTGAISELFTNGSQYLSNYGEVFACLYCSSTSGAIDSSMNFGSPSYAVSSGNTDGNGYGNFEYAVPSGYYALCTKNLAEYG